MTINQLLQKCSRKGITPYAVCQRSGISQVTVSRWKKQDHQPLPETLELFEQAARAIAEERGLTW